MRKLIPYKCGCSSKACNCCKRSCNEDQLSQDCNITIRCFDAMLQKHGVPIGFCPYCNGYAHRIEHKPRSAARAYEMTPTESQLNAYSIVNKSKGYAFILGALARVYPDGLAPCEILGNEKNRQHWPRISELVDQGFIVYIESWAISTWSEQTDPENPVMQQRVRLVPGMKEAVTDPKFAPLWEKYWEREAAWKIASFDQRLTKFLFRNTMKPIHDLIERNRKG